ncbi:hypothetical protein SI65_09922 [Aspergillus cristatus]|uniref:Pyrroline-5-carboxylate reductase n=1 Tax=Aspergillus cristatus TaxID=573508 RepID=A0A1E3B1C1_ASPCR|nr:hypothetical protein SI65_09922 [Aspergillus cristatus]
MTELKSATLCVLGCGNLGTAIINSLACIPPTIKNSALFTHFIACVRTQNSENRLRDRLSHLKNLSISRNNNIKAMDDSAVIILATDPADVERTLTQPGFRDAITDKLLISVAAGWTQQRLYTTLYGNDTPQAHVVRALPNIAALVSQSLTAVESSIDSPLPLECAEITDAIFNRIGRTVHVSPTQMEVITAVGGSTPAFFAVIVDAMIDAAVAVGLPRDLAHTAVFQAMQGTAGMLQSGIHPALLKDQGTSPEGCTIGGLMVLEEAGVRGHVGKALREAVTIARLMGKVPHVNDTRQ